MSKILRIIFLSVIVVLLGIYISLFIWDYNIKKMHANPLVKCEDIRSEEVYCMKKFLYYRELRFSTKKSDNPNCCIMQLKESDKNSLSYSVLACDKKDRSIINCGNVEKFKI